MITKRKSFNVKRRIADARIRADLDRLADQVRYGGNPEHKRNPGDFGLTPPASPRPDKTFCDGANILKRDIALSLLKSGILRGLVSAQNRKGFPQNIWAVTEDGVPLEAQLENADNGTYHGYPMPEADAFRETVIAKWEACNE